MGVQEGRPTRWPNVMVKSSYGKLPGFESCLNSSVALGKSFDSPSAPTLLRQLGRTVHPLYDYFVISITHTC